MATICSVIANCLCGGKRKTVDDFYPRLEKRRRPRRSGPTPEQSVAAFEAMFTVKGQ